MPSGFTNLEISMKKYRILKLVGLAILTMITLVIISILEVTIYSYVINPGHDQLVYKGHATVSAPYISAIFGFVIFFLTSRFWQRKGYYNVAQLVWLFPLVYVLLDLVLILSVGNVKWSEFILIFMLANGAKLLGSFLGYKLSST